jgi:nitric oxide reductase subunit B
MVIAFLYIALQKWRGNVYMGGNLVGAWKWKWALFLLHAGMITMVMAMLISGYEQSQIERAIEGSTWMGYFAGQSHRWFMQGMFWRQIGGWVFTAGFVLLAWDLLTIGKRETRPAYVVPAETVSA